MSQEPLSAQLKKVSGEFTLGLSFWDVFRREASDICQEAKDYDGRPWIELEEKIPPLDDFAKSVHELRLKCGCFQFAATLDPMSLAIVYANYLIGMESVMDSARELISRGMVLLSHKGDSYSVRAIPPIHDLLLSEEPCSYDEFWQVGRELARWACGSISLRRLGELKGAVIGSIDIVLGEIDR